MSVKKKIVKKLIKNITNPEKSKELYNILKIIEILNKT